MSRTSPGSISFTVIFLRKLMSFSYAFEFLDFKILRFFRLLWQLYFSVKFSNGSECILVVSFLFINADTELLKILATRGVKSTSKCWTKEGRNRFECRGITMQERVKVPKRSNCTCPSICQISWLNVQKRFKIKYLIRYKLYLKTIDSLTVDDWPFRSLQSDVMLNSGPKYCVDYAA